MRNLFKLRRNLEKTQRRIIDTAIEAVGATALHYASNSGNIEQVKRLINDGENINVIDGVGKTALHYACQNNKLEVAEFLIENGIYTAARDFEGKIALEYAMQNKNMHIIRVLYRLPELIKATIDNNLEEVKRLLNFDVIRERVVLNYAKQYNHKEILNYVLNTVSDKKDSRGNTTLHWAVSKGYIDMVKSLTSVYRENSLDTNILNSDNLTVLELAKISGSKEMYELLKIRTKDKIVEYAIDYLRNKRVGTAKILSSIENTGFGETAIGMEK